MRSEFELREEKKIPLTDFIQGRKVIIGIPVILTLDHFNFGLMFRLFHI